MELKEKIEAYSRSKSESMPYGPDYLGRVYASSRKIAIASRTNYDDEILHAACFLHIIDTEEPRVRMSAKKAAKFLMTIDFPADKAESVVAAIKGQTPSMRPEGAEARLLHDAVMLEFLGAVGFARIIAICSERSKRGLAECIEEVKKQKDMAFRNLIFQECKEMAGEKLKFIEDAIAQAEKEMK